MTIEDAGLRVMNWKAIKETRKRNATRDDTNQWISWTKFEKLG